MTNKKTPPGSIRAVNKKGTVTFFSETAWKLLNPDKEGYRNGWLEVKEGEQPENVLKTANIPPELQSAGQKQAQPNFTDEEKKAMIADEVAAQVADQISDINAKHDQEISDLNAKHDDEMGAVQAALQESSKKNEELTLELEMTKEELAKKSVQPEVTGPADKPAEPAQ